MVDSQGQDGGGQDDPGRRQQEERETCGARADESDPAETGHQSGRLPGHHQASNTQAAAAHHVFQLVHHSLHHVRPRPLLAEPHWRPLPQLHHRNHPGLPGQDPGHDPHPEGGAEVSLHVRLPHHWGHVPPHPLHRA